MRKPVWDNPNKMHMETEFKTFNEQTNVITTGQVFANTQRSVCIPPISQTEINGCSFPIGHCTESALKFGGFTGNLPPKIREIVYDKNRTEYVILYAFRVFHKGKENVFGYIVTDKDYRYLHHHVVYTYGANYNKRVDAIRECMTYVCK